MQTPWATTEPANHQPLLQPRLILLIEKKKRQLTLYSHQEVLLRCKIALGRCPEGRKRQEGDGKTPEGIYTICLVKEQGKYGRSLGLSYPNRQDADLALREGRIDLSTHQVILDRLSRGEGGTASDWTQGCIALESGDMDVLFPHWEDIRQVEIVP